MANALASFNLGFPGAVTRSVDDIVIALPNRDLSALDFGVPVVLNDEGTGAKKFTSSSTAADFVGFTLRSASKTPETYGSSTGSYATEEMMDVLTRGTTVVTVSTGTPVPGGPVYVVKATGQISAMENAENNVELTNVKFRSQKDGRSRAEVVILSRNKQ